MSLAAVAEALSLSAHAWLVAQAGTYAHAAFSCRTGQILYAESAQAAELRSFKSVFDPPPASTNSGESS